MTRSKILILSLCLLSATWCKAATLPDTVVIKAHLKTLTKTPRYRSHQNIDQLNQTADYIRSVFKKYADSVYIQEYTVDQKIYKNVICSFGTQHQKRIIAGAHYDSCGEQEGADDNASGVTGLLELARMLKGQKLNHRIDLVAYTLEEPPYFRTEQMGSYIHAKWLKSNKIEVYGMLSLEMIGYFKTEKKSQSYPLGILSWFYGNKGDYITVIKKFSAGKFANNFTSAFKKGNTILTKTFSGPTSLPGIDFSDHLNYWKFGYSALMITDTSFYRNKNYHQVTDTMETLDINRMAKVIDGVFKTLVKI
ncbi:M28 family peptidase [Pedobacter sp. HDW13]|uniref:M28 family peptidase n=1 Tax=Pedobacter sp. HDW13 TaxID=2714940 RepID=UPI0014083A61|nr:M28 family peptidase [Pedobacter sp. HDW13]QIL40935.1 M28 family peptidase [Pedobacter sp. HDW13]